MNAVTRPFAHPIVRFDEAVGRASDAKRCITADLDAGRWQVKINKDSKEKIAFMTKTGKKHFCSMPMGAMNTHACFAAMTSKMEIKWNKSCNVRTKRKEEIEWNWLKDEMEKAMAACRKEMRKKSPNKPKTPNSCHQQKRPTSNRQKPNKRDPKPGSFLHCGHGHVILFHLHGQDISTLPSNNQPKKKQDCSQLELSSLQLV